MTSVAPPPHTRTAESSDDWITPKWRLTFHYPDGSAPKAGHNSGGPSVLIAYGDRAADRLHRNKELGALVVP